MLEPRVEQRTIITAFRDKAGQIEANPSPADVHWYAAYTCANREKKVAAELERRSVQVFFPVYNSMRRWKDRRINLEMPLFPGYVFVRLDLSNRLKVLQVPGVARLVGFGASPVALPDEQIHALRIGLCGQYRAEPHPLLTSGRQARIKGGPLAGMRGLVIRRKNRFRFVILLELIRCAASVEIEESNLEPI